MSVVSPPRTSLSGVITLTLTRDELRQRVLTRLLEKHDPAKAKHKPMSLQRAELRRAAETLLDAEHGPPPGAERERLLEEILADVPGFGPLDELFRDESLTEFLILAHNQVIRRSLDGWLPTSVQFRDVTHYRDTLKRLLQSATPIGDVPKTSDGGADAMLPNGFRVIAILPPRVMNLPPTAVFRRGESPAPEPAPVLKASGVIPAPRSSGVVPVPAPVGSGVEPAVSASRMLDPWERTRNRVTARLVQRLAANGVTDLGSIPTAELRRIIAAYVTEFNQQEKLNLDNSSEDRMTLEILSGMPR